MLSLTYVSSAATQLDFDVLADMLATIRPKNQALGITGMLLYSDGNIIQTLEGPDDVVEATFKTIARDPRHGDVIVILREPIGDRAFPNWSMGFKRIAARDLNSLEGFNAFMNDPLAQSLGDSASSAYRLLEIFRDTVR